MASIDFFATPSEIAQWLDEWVTKWVPNVALIRFFPVFCIQQLDSGRNIPHQVQSFGHLDEVCIRNMPFNVETRGNFHFLTANPDSVVMMIPQLVENHLEQGDIGLTVDAIQSRQLYRNIARDLRLKTICGMWIYYQYKEEWQYSKKLRYSPGAKVLLEQGVTLGPRGGGLRAQILQPDRPAQQQLEDHTSTAPDAS